MAHFFNKINPAQVAWSYVIIAMWLIVTAFFMQTFFDIRPCELCLWQRIPYYVIMFGSILIPLRFVRLTLVIQAIAFFINIIISAYHSGIERKWWKGLSGCSSFDIQNLSIDELHQQLLNTAMVKCDEISWSLFGLSLTNYNFLISLILGLSAIYCIRGYDAQSKSKHI